LIQRNNANRNEDSVAGHYDKDGNLRVQSTNKKKRTDDLVNEDEVDPSGIDIDMGGKAEESNNTDAEEIIRS